MRPTFIGLVYSRRPTISCTADSTADGIASDPPAPVDVFIQDVTKPLDAVLATPVIQKSAGRQPRAITEPPRRSRRVAKLPPEIVNNPAADSVCPTLGFEEIRTEAAFDKYQRFWASPLVRNHVKAMTTMIGKVLPEDTTLPVADAIAVA